MLQLIIVVVTLSVYVVFHCLVNEDLNKCACSSVSIDSNLVFQEDTFHSWDWHKNPTFSRSVYKLPVTIATSKVISNFTL